MRAFAETHRPRGMISFDVGPIYPEGVRPGAPGDYLLESELRVDVDLNDYKERRFCGCGEDKTCCAMCWDVFICKVAVPILQKIAAQWGFKDTLFVASGNRGIHFWVRDERVMKWTKQQRELFLAILKDPPPNLFREIVEEIYWPVFEKYILRLNKRCPSLTGAENASNEALWNHKKHEMQPHEFEAWSWQCMHSLLYVATDKEVTVTLTHKCKLPFSLHQTSGNCTVPLPRPTEPWVKTHASHMKKEIVQDLLEQLKTK
jgi:DNA primase catalytic subunit